MPAPIVSVVITTYNREALLEKCIDSALNQTYPSELVEIIVVDDGSTDGTKDFIANRYSGIERLHYIYKPNGGPCSGTALGVAKARGKYVAQLDSDDYWYPEKLARCIPLFEQADDVVGVLHDLDLFEDQGQRKAGTWWGSASALLRSEPQSLLQAYLDGQPVKAVTSASVWQRTALNRVLPFPAGMWGHHDTYILRHLLLEGRLCGVNACLGGYLIHSGNISAIGKGNAGMSMESLTRLANDTRLMTASFNEHCARLNVTIPERRRVVQAHALAELEIASLQWHSAWAALRRVFASDLHLTPVHRLDLLGQLLLPQRIATFLRARLLSKIYPLD